MRRRTHIWRTTKIEGNIITEDVIDYISKSPDHVLTYINYVRFTDFIGDEQSLKELHDKFYKDLPLEIRTGITWKR